MSELESPVEPEGEDRLCLQAALVEKFCELARQVARDEIASMLGAILQDDASSFEIRSVAGRLLPLFEADEESRPGAEP